MTGLVVTFEHGFAAAAGAVVLMVMFAMVARRRPAVPRGTLVLGALGAALLTLAAGGLTALRPAGTPVEVWVDISPSTRGAAYRDPAALRRRVRELLGDTRYEIRFFAE